MRELKFKVGDKVKVVKNKLEEVYDKYIGKVGIITYADCEDSELTYLISEISNHEYFNEEELELFEKVNDDIKKVIMPTFEEIKCRHNKDYFYIAGHMLNRANANRRIEESDEIKSLGYETWNPIQDKTINSKNGLDRHTNDNLSKRIVRNDVTGILTSGNIVIEPEVFSLGSLVENGKIFAYVHVGEMIKEILEENKYDNGALVDELNLLVNILDKKVYPHIDDIRAENGVDELNYNRSWGVNQYIRGTNQALTSTEDGFFSWEDIIDKIKK